MDKRTQLEGGPTPWFLSGPQGTDTHPFLLAGVTLAPGGPGGQDAVAGLWWDAGGAGAPGPGHAVTGAQGLLATVPNNTRASGCETVSSEDLAPQPMPV